MSIVLKAFPMGFLISPNAPNQDISGPNYNLDLEKKNLEIIKVATNFRENEIAFFMSNVYDCTRIDENNYSLKNGMNVTWQFYNGHYCAFITRSKINIPTFGKHISNSSELTKYGEEFFKTLDVIANRNVRDIGSKEIFYYCYKTSYRTKEEILDILKKNNIENITTQTDTEIAFRVNNKNYKYVKNNKVGIFYIETEQKISLVNIAFGKKPLMDLEQNTNYTDKDMLLKTLSEHGAENIQADDYNISCEMYGMKLLYSKDYMKGAYNLEITQITNNSKCEQLLSDLEEEYGLNIQDLTYRRIVEQLAKQNMRLENEEVDDDNSIVLTIDLG